MFNLFNITDIH